MKNSVILSGLFVLCILQGCSKPDGPPEIIPADTIVPANYIAYVSKIGLGDYGIAYTSYYYDPVNNFASIVSGGTPNATFYYDNVKNITRLDLNADYITLTGSAFFINYDTNGVPVSGTRITSSSGSSKSTGTKITDSILYKSINGKIAEAYFYNRTAIVYTYAPYPNDTTSSRDTTEVYKITYTGDNITKLYAETRYQSLKIIETDFTYGNAKGAFADQSLKYLLTPDQFTSSGYRFMGLYTRNDLLSYRKTFLTQGNHKEASVFTYTYNKYKYPETVTQADSGTAYNTKAKALIEYKQ